MFADISETLDSVAMHRCGTSGGPHAAPGMQAICFIASIGSLWGCVFYPPVPPRRRARSENRLTSPSIGSYIFPGLYVPPVPR